MGAAIMLKRSMFFFVLFGLLFLNGCTEGKGKGLAEFKFKEESFPPSPAGFFSSDTKRYQMEQGNFEWRKDGMVTTTDHAGPTQIAESYSPVVVAPGEMLTIEIEQNPKITSFIWEGEERTEVEEGNKINIPKREGRYIYEVMAEWTDGEVSYTFVVEVK